MEMKDAYIILIRYLSCTFSSCINSDNRFTDVSKFILYTENEVWRVPLRKLKVIDNTSYIAGLTGPIERSEKSGPIAYFSFKIDFF